MSNNPKQRVAEHATRIRAAVFQQEPLAAAMVDLLQAAIDETKDSLVGSEGDDTLRLQGAARLCQRLHRELTVMPPSTKPKE